MSRKHYVLIAGFAVLAVLVLGLFFFIGRTPETVQQTGEIVKLPDPVAVPDAANSIDSPLLQPIDDGQHQQLSDPNVCTVAWPVKLRLELLQDASQPRVAGVGSLGSGATARFAGSLSDDQGEPLNSSLEFIAGPNQGRVLRTNSRGKFGASDLLPGLAVVAIDGPGDLDPRREVRLRAGAETLLNIGFGLPGAASGKVLDRDGKPIEAATVELDGQTTFTDAAGAFLFPSVPSGLDIECITSKQGYASYSERITIAARTTNDHLVFTLLPGATLEVEVPEAIGSPGDATLVLMNANSAAQRSFPWRKVSPASIRSGARLRIDDLPPGLKVRVYVFHQGAVAKPVYDEVTLQEGVPQLATLHLEAAPLIVGTVRTRDGLVAQGAKVRLEAPDQVGSTVAYFGETAMFLESEVLPRLPMAVQETLSDHNGRFEFTSYPKQAPKRYLTAVSADGLSMGTGVVSPESETVDVTISPFAGGSAKLRLEFPGRFQSVPVECSVRGAPLNPVLVPAEEPYVIEGLAPGIWRLTATWNGKEFPTSSEAGAAERGFKLEGETTQVIHLPQGAIQGQDADTLLRAGRKP